MRRVAGSRLRVALMALAEALLRALMRVLEGRETEMKTMLQRVDNFKPALTNMREKYDRLRHDTIVNGREIRGDVLKDVKVLDGFAERCDIPMMQEALANLARKYESIPSNKIFNGREYRQMVQRDIDELLKFADRIPTI